MKADKAPRSLADIIRRRQGEAAARREAWALLGRLALITALGWVIFTQVFLVVRVQGLDMYPALADGDLAVAFRLSRAPAPSDVIIYRAEGQRRIGRVAAVAGDLVESDGAGNLLVNGAAQSGLPAAGRGLEYPYRVPQDYLFVVQDHPGQGTDSQVFGGVPLADVEGKVMALMRHRGI